MRSAIVQMPSNRTAGEHRQVLRAATRQLERADVYLAAVTYMELDDPAARRALSRLRADVASLRRHLAERRTGITA